MSFEINQAVELLLVRQHHLYKPQAELRYAHCNRTCSDTKGNITITYMSHTYTVYYSYCPGCFWSRGCCSVTALSVIILLSSRSSALCHFSRYPPTCSFFIRNIWHSLLLFSLTVFFLNIMRHKEIMRARADH